MDKVVLYYFTGTGNSLYAAREIGKRLNGKLVSIASQMDFERIDTEADIIGIIFPVYNSMNDGLPLIVIKFAKKLVNLQSKYIFAVCTSGSGMTPSNESLSHWISAQGGKLSAFFTLKMPFNIKPVPNVTKQMALFESALKKIETISTTVQEKKDVGYGIPSAVKLITAPLGALMRSFFITKMRKQTNSPNARSFYELTPLMDKCFFIDEKCDGCTICSKICPVKNIEIINDKPLWKHHCETCLACFHWCPKEAIHSSYSNIRYHHPEVKLSDMI